MVLYVELTAVGPFTPAVVSALEYPAEHYEGTRPGTPVVLDIFGIVEGTHAGTEFARLLGITDVWDFNQHKIDPQAADVDGLKRLFATLANGDEYLADLERFEILRRHGFEFYFRPNG